MIASSGARHAPPRYGLQTFCKLEIVNGAKPHTPFSHSSAAQRTSPLHDAPVATKVAHVLVLAAQ